MGVFRRIGGIGEVLEDVWRGTVTEDLCEY